MARRHRHFSHKLKSLPVLPNKISQRIKFSVSTHALLPILMRSSPTTSRISMRNAHGKEWMIMERWRELVYEGTDRCREAKNYSTVFMKKFTRKSRGTYRKDMCEWGFQEGKQWKSIINKCVWFCKNYKNSCGKWICILCRATHFIFHFIFSVKLADFNRNVYRFLNANLQVGIVFMSHHEDISKLIRWWSF